MRYNCTCPEYEEHSCMNPNEGELERQDCCYEKEEEDTRLPGLSTRFMR